MGVADILKLAADRNHDLPDARRDRGLVARVTFWDLGDLADTMAVPSLRHHGRIRWRDWWLTLELQSSHASYGLAVARRGSSQMRGSPHL